ncbi:uncharacterized protein LOC111049128 [Nilaparvata lugens]|uniref:uncharacterized protein LOC111049128 n=1 Tax=Nilaparvata lugens TaxID=108931 RepID=UPI00193E4BB2|nr:uncharacterized protein LOC111049128 [Nilaparvata lugens]
MQMNQVIYIALMSSFFLSSASAMFKSGAQEAGWEAVYNLIDTRGKGYITIDDLPKFFKSEHGIQFNGNAREGITNLVRSKGGKLYKNQFIEYLRSRGQQITTLKALQNAFPGKSSVLGSDLNKKFKLEGSTVLQFHANEYYGLQEAANMIDDLMK